MHADRQIPHEHQSHAAHSIPLGAAATEASLREQEPVDPVLAFLGQAAGIPGAGGPKIQPRAEAMAAALTPDQYGQLESRAAALASEAGRPLDAGFYSDAASQYAQRASALKAAGHIEEATRQLAMNRALVHLARRAREQARQRY